MTTDNGNETSGGAEPTADELVADYLRELEGEAARLPWHVRQELMDDMRSHIEVARSEADAGEPDRETVLRVLASLGDPAEIVAAADGEAPPRLQQDAAPSSSSTFGAPYGETGFGRAGYGNPYSAGPPYDAGPPYPLGAGEIWALILLIFGGLFAGVGWFIGLFLLWNSSRWNTRDKLIGTFLVPGGLVSGMVLFGQTGSGRSCAASSTNTVPVCSGGPTVPTWITFSGALLVLVVPFLSAIYLRNRARRVRPADWATGWVLRRRGGAGTAVVAGLIVGLLIVVILGGVFAVSSGSHSDQPATPGASMVASQAPEPVFSSR